MSANRWLLALALLGLGYVTTTQAEEAIRWQTSLENATRLAQQTDRLVLIHFWNDGCPPCRRMEQEVFSRPDVAVAIERDYVPVKIKTSHAPTTAKRFGITLVPADVVVTPQGKVVTTKVGAMSATDYVTHFGRLASDTRRTSPPQPPQVAANAAPAASNASYSGAPDYSTNSAGTQPPVGTPPYAPPQPVASQAAPPETRIPPGNPPLALEGYCPVSLNEHARWIEGDPRYGVRHEGRTYLFAGPEEKNRFFATPNRYAPAFSGNDLVLYVEQGRTESGNRRYGGWYNDRIYLFASGESYQRFVAAPERYVAAANRVASRPPSHAAPPSWHPSSTPAASRR